MKQRGMTLVELLTTLAVFSILLGIAVSGYGFLVNGTRLASMTNQLNGALSYARSEAIKRGVRVSLCKSASADTSSPACDTGSGWQHGWLVFVDRGVIGTFDGADHLLTMQTQKPDDISVTTTNFSTYASYLPSGVSQGPTHLGTGRFHIYLGDKLRCLIINKTGRVRLGKDKKTCST